MNVGSNYLREHISEKARIHYVIPHGGGEPNVVPDYAQVWYYVRAPKRNEVERIYNRVVNIAKGACLMTDTTMDLEFLVGCHEILPNKALSEIMIRNMRTIGPPKWSEEEHRFAKKLAESMTLEDRRDSLEITYAEKGREGGEVPRRHDRRTRRREGSDGRIDRRG
jgi:aminobenzoyl-glutamate utilization protein B